MLDLWQSGGEEATEEGRTYESHLRLINPDRIAPAGLSPPAAGNALPAVVADFVHAHSLSRPSAPEPGAMERIGGMMRRLGLQSECTLVQPHVLLGRAPPGEVLLHPATDQSLPLFLVSIDLQREQYGAQQHFRSWQGESETGGGLLSG